MHTNRTNGKRYIGWTSKTMEERWQFHCMMAMKFNSRLIFHQAIRKYGPESFDHKVLVVTESMIEAKNYEKTYIELHQTFAFDLQHWGYNGTRGGDGAVGHKHTPETLIRMSESQKGEKNHMFGKKTSDEVRQKLSEKLKGCVFTEEHRANLRKSCANLVVSEETKLKISKTLSGRTQSEETKQKRREALKQSWARKKEIQNFCPICEKPRTLRNEKSPPWHVSCKKRQLV